MNHSSRRSVGGSSRRLFLGALGRRQLLRSSGLESLEKRHLLSADFPSDVLAGEETSADSGSIQGPTVGALEGAEGEHDDQPDLVAFAKALDAAGVTFFGAAWCPHCTAQKELFEDGARFLPFVEVTNPDTTRNAIGIAENITSYPTWEFQDGTRVTGEQSLETLSQMSGIAIPMSSDPFIAPIADTTLLNGSPLHVAIDGYDPNADTLTYTVSSDNPNVSVVLLEGNDSMRIQMANYGTMTFELFEQRVPRATDAIQARALADGDNYDGVICHRVIDDFVVQCGDPTGTGFGDESLPRFDDQFHLDLQHNTTGLLSMAKSGDDTNTTQFFITEGSSRHLDFNHSVFGLMTEGEAVREALSEVPVNASDRPITNLVMQSVTIFTDVENRVMMLKANDDAVGETATITVTVTDAEGEEYTETFEVTVQNDTVNGGPFLDDIPVITTTTDVPAVFQLTANDVEGDAVIFSAVKQGTVDYTFDVDSSTGEVTVTPPSGFVGEMEILVRVRPATTSGTNDTFDSQLVTITVGPGAPTSVDLLQGSDSGASDSDDITNASSLQFLVDGVTNGATVRLLRDGTQIASGTATGGVVTLTTTALASLPDGQYTLTATQTIDGETSPASPGLTITKDTTAPGAFTTQPPTAATVSTAYSYDAASPDEGAAGFAYSLSGAPTGVTIDEDTGVVSWTPTQNQVGNHGFDIVATDVAGNSTSQTANVEVSAIEGVVNIRLQTAALDGTPITEVAGGSTFLLQVFVQDIRQFPDLAQGVFAAYLDVLYDSTLATALDSFTFGPKYPNLPRTDVSSPGLIDDTGAFANDFTPLGDEEFLLFSVVIEAGSVLTEGETLTFVAEPSDAAGTEVLVYGSDDSVNTDDVVYGQTSIMIIGADILVPDIFNVDEDTSNNSLNVLQNDDLSGLGDVEITAVSGISNGGAVTIASDGQSLLYTPAADFFGTETFNYTVTVGDQTATTTVQVQVHPINDPPTANDDNASVNEDSSNNFLDVQINDTSDPDATEVLEIVSVSASSQGATITIAPNGTHLLYTPPANFTGSDTFTYTLEDPSGLTDTATVTVTVSEVNDTPTAVEDEFDVDEDSTNNTLDVLDNDTDPEDDDLTITAVGATSQGGTVTIASDSLSLIYTPAADFQGTETFTYTITDGGTMSTETVVVNVANVNDPPTAVDDSHVDNSDLVFTKNTGPHTLDVLANDLSDPDPEESFEITSVTQGSDGGTVSISSDGLTLRYTPATDFVGTETFTYTMEDEDGATDTAMVTVSVLDFAPRSVYGMVPFEGTRALGGVDVVMEGTDMFGSSVSMTTKTNSYGEYTFADVAPGSYSVRALDSERFLFNHTTPISVESAAEDGDAADNDFQSMARTPRYIGIGDYLSSTPQRYVLAAIDTTDGAHWYSVTDGWESVTDLSIELEADFSEMTLTATRDDGRIFEATMTSLAAEGVHLLGTEGTTHLLRIPGGFDGLGFVDTGETVDGTDGDGDGEGEGEAVAAAFSGAEGEASAARVLSTGDSEAPPPLDAEGESPVVATRAAGSSNSTPSNSRAQALSSPASVGSISLEQSNRNLGMSSVASDTGEADTPTAGLSMLTHLSGDSEADADEQEREDEQTAVDDVMTELSTRSDPSRRTVAIEESVTEESTAEEFEQSVDAILEEEDGVIESII